MKQSPDGRRYRGSSTRPLLTRERIVEHLDSDVRDASRWQRWQRELYITVLDIAWCYGMKIATQFVLHLGLYHISLISVPNFRWSSSHQ